MTQQVQDLNLTTVLADMRKQDSEIVNLRERLAQAQAETITAKELADLRVKQAEVGQKSVVIRDRDMFGRPIYTNLVGLDEVTASLRVDLDKVYQSRITKLENQIESSEKTIKQLREEAKDASVSYDKALKLIKDENDTVRRAERVAVENEKLRLVEEHIAKLDGFKKTKKDLEKQLADVQEELQKERENKTDRELAETIKNEMNKLQEAYDKLSAENEILRRNSFGVRILEFIHRIKPTKWSSYKLRDAVRSRYNYWNI